MAIEYVGTRWHKCDLHLHTPASKCFKDKSITPEQWVQEALDKGLSCVAVTDHNTNQWISQIQEASRGTELTVFPGVEITCSDAKVHLLIIFGTDKTAQDIYNFLLLAGIESDVFGEQEAHANKTITEIAELAHERGAIVIPAHVDEYNGLSQVGDKTLNDFLDLPFVNAVQVVHEDFLLDDTLYQKNRDKVKTNLEEYYGKPIEEVLIKTWKKAVRTAAEKGKAILTFSDNPHEKGNSKHGLWGVGRRYTWIKMEHTPSLEGLRQAFLAPDYRVRNDFECKAPNLPYLLPDHWIEKIVISNTAITHQDYPLEISFSPQLTTIIGGRGSGKSSILRFIRGLFQSKVEELRSLGEKTFVYRDFESFFKVSNQNGVESGALNEGTIIEIFFHRYGNRFKVRYEQKNRSQSEITAFRFDKIKGDFSRDDSEGLIDLFEFDIFAQKQIYDIGSRTNSLRNRIDTEVPEIAEIKNDLKEQRNEYYQKSAELRRIEDKVKGKEKLKTEIADFRERLNKLLKENELLEERERFEKQQEAIQLYEGEIQQNSDLFAELIEKFEVPEIPFEEGTELAQIALTRQEEIKKFAKSLTDKQEELSKIIEQYQNEIKNSQWKKDDEASKMRFEEAKQNMMEEEGIDFEDIDALSVDLKKKESRLLEIENEEKNLSHISKSRESVKKLYFNKRKQLTERRKQFLNDLLSNTKVKASVGHQKDIEDLEQNLRQILNTEAYHSSFEKILTEIKSGEMAKTCQEFIKKVYDYRKTADRSAFLGIDGGLLTNFRNLNGQQLDDLDLLTPEDEITISYKTSDLGKFKPISNLSPGQKTASILTILLAHKNTPLILDQPEDDLDSFLIYALIVEQLRISKESRQVIVVSHNANIPVNGDSEQIVVMDPESRYVRKLTEGSIDNKEIKELVLKVMEGGKDAFDYRSKRYKVEK